MMQQCAHGVHAGVRRHDLERIMAAGKIPLIDAEAISFVASFQSAGVECLPIFLSPPSLDTYRDRVHLWLRETPRALGRYNVDARQQARQVVQARFYDEVLPNVKLNQTVEHVVDVARKYRPDLFKDVSTGEEDPYSKEPWRAICAVYLAGA
jgi:guanylate kinase